MMNKNLEIKTVYRAPNLPETNSSSSHSVCICMDETKNLHPGDKGFDLNIVDGVLYVPSRTEGSFGWEFRKSNSCLVKLQYLCSFYFNSYSPLWSQKAYKKLTEILKKILGVKDVVYEWVEEYNEALKNFDLNDEDKLAPADIPEIDHQSYSDMKEDITENLDTIKNFLLNPDSWWFGGNDNSNEPDRYFDELYYYQPNKDLEGIVTADFGGSIGKVDFRIDFPEDFFLESCEGVDRDVLDSICYNTKKKEFFIDNSPSYSRRSKSDILEYEGSIIIDSTAYILFIGGGWRETLINYVFPSRTDKDRSNEWLLRRTMEHENTKEGRDYILLKVSLYVPKFGYIYE